LDKVRLSKYKGEAQYDLRIPDAVATLLFKFSEETLKQFLDARINKFKLVQKFNRHIPDQMQLVIWRQNTQVLVSIREDYCVVAQLLTHFDS
jgi:hypothetical protein